MNMTARLLLIAGLACSALIPSAHADVLYSETFPNSSGTDKTLSYVGWGFVSATDSVSNITTTTTAHGVVSAALGSDNTTAGFIYAQPGKNGGTRVFTESNLTTTTYPGLTLDNIGAISFDGSASISSISVQILIQTNNSTWYSSTQSFTLNNYNSFTTAATNGVLTYSLNFSSATWNATTFNVGELLSISGTSSALSGDITGIGFLVKNNSTSSGSTVRLDNLTVTSAVPEPSSYALVLGGLCAAGTLVRRHRRA